jgi:hypothetical protein
VAISRGLRSGLGWWKFQRCVSTARPLMNITNIIIKRLRKVINVINNPLTEQDNYPKDIFPPISKARLHQINGFLKANFGFPLDRLSAHIARKILAVRIEEEKSAKRLLKSKLCGIDPICKEYMRKQIDACFQIPDGDEEHGKE